MSVKHIKYINSVIRTTKTNYIRRILSSSVNTPIVSWKLVNREILSLNNTLTCNVHLQVVNETV
jgi:hypothetical protein